MISVTTLYRALATNSTASSFATLIPTVTKPVAKTLEEGVDGIVDLGRIGHRPRPTPTHLFVHLFGAGSENNGVKMKVVGWNKVENLWIPKNLVSVTALLGTSVGVASQIVINTDRFADTIVMVSQPVYTGTNASDAALRGDVKLYSPADNTLAWLSVPVLDSELVQFVFDKDAATNVNALFKFLRFES